MSWLHVFWVNEVCLTHTFQIYLLVVEAISWSFKRNLEPFSFQIAAEMQSMQGPISNDKMV